MQQAVILEIEYKGIKTAIASQNDLAKQIKETRAELKAATDQGSDGYKNLEKRLGVLTAIQKENNSRIREQQREFTASGKAGVGAYKQLSAQLNVARARLKDLQAARELKIEVDDKEIEQLQQQVDKLDSSLKRIDAGAGQFQRNVGDYPNTVTSVFREAAGSVNVLGTNIGALGAAGPVAAVGAVALGVQQLGDFVVQTNKEFKELQKRVRELTGAEGDNLDELTTRVKTLSDVFGQDFQDVLRAVNAESKQTGISTDKALRAIETRFLAGANASGELLDSISEYSTFISEAGLSTEQFSNILVQSQQQGIFSDKGIDVVKEVTLRLRELPTSTQAALEGIGLSSQEISELIAEKGIGAAIAKVSEQLGTLRADSPEVGAAIADIFGGPGEDAGLSYLLSLKNITAETGSLIDETNTFVQVQRLQLDSTQRLNEAQNKLANAFGNGEGELSAYLDILKAGLIEALVELVDTFALVFRNIKDVGQALGILGSESVDAADKAKAVSDVFNVLLVPGLRIATSGFRILTSLITEATLTIQSFGKAISDLDFSGAFFVFDGFAGRVQERAFGQGGSKSILDRIKEGAKAEADRVKSSVRGINTEREARAKANEEIKKTSDSAKEQAIIAKNSISALRKAASELESQIQTTDISDTGTLVELNRQADEAKKKLKEAEDLLFRLTNERQEVQFQFGALSAGGLGAVQGGAAPTDINKEREEQNKKNLDAALAAIEVEKQERIKAAREAGDAIEDINTASEIAKLEATLQIANLQYDERLRLENELAAARISLEEQVAARVSQSIQSSIQQASEFVQVGFELLNAKEQEATEKRLDRIEQQRAREIELAEGNAELEADINERYDRKREREERKEFNRQKKRAISEAFINAAVAALRVGTQFPPPTPAFFAGIALVGGQLAAQLASISAQQFADGGFVKGANIPQLANGDNVIATLKTGEVVLNQRQQSQLERLTGMNMGNIASLVGLPKFADGGFVGRPSASVQRSFSAVTPKVEFSAEQIETLSEALGQGVADGSFQGTLNGAKTGTQEGIVESNQELQDDIINGI